MQNEQIGFVVKSLNNLIQRQVESGGEEIRDLTMMQRWIIRYLAERQGKDVYQKDIERAFTIRRSTATGILKLMEKKGWILREAAEGDQRCKKITLTPKAVHINSVIWQNILNTEARLSGCLTAEEIRTFLAITEKLIQNLQETV